MSGDKNNKSASVAEQLKDCLGHAFSDESLLEDALTHPSLAASVKSRQKSKSVPYERLEFLGDRVLGLVVAQWLYTLFPDAPEGDLAKRHSALVNRDALRHVALKIGLKDYIRLAPGEMVAFERKNMAALSDAVEAVIGAMYLDAGLAVADRFIHRYWTELTHVEVAPSDPKTALQEWAQGHKCALPVYRIVERTGLAHAPHFKMSAEIEGFPLVEANGPSKRVAEKEAAEKLLSVVLGAKDN